MRKVFAFLPLVALVLVGCGKDKAGEPAASKSGATKPAGDQAYTIKVKWFPDVNKSTTLHEKKKEQGTSKAVFMGKKQENKEDGEAEKIYTTTTLEAGDKFPKKFKRFYEKATASKASKELPKSYQGKTILFTLTDGQYQATVEGGGNVDEKDLKKLTKDVNELVSGKGITVFLPTKPVKVGESWTFDPKSGLGDEDLKGADFDSQGTKGKAKLQRVYTEDNKQHGVLEIELEVVMKSLPLKIPDFKLDKPAQLSGKATWDVVIDGSSTQQKTDGTMKMAFKGAQEKDGKKLLELEVDTTSTDHEEISAEK